MRVRVKSATWIYYYYQGYSGRALSLLLKRKYREWARSDDSDEQELIRKIEAWNYVKGLITLARDRKIFDERTWEIKR